MRVAIVARTAKRRGGTESYLFDLVAASVLPAARLMFTRPTTPGTARPPRRARACMSVRLPWRGLDSALDLCAALKGPLARERHDVVISLARINGGDLAICGGTHRGYLAVLGCPLGWRDRSEDRA